MFGFKLTVKKVNETIFIALEHKQSKNVERFCVFGFFGKLNSEMPLFVGVSLGTDNTYKYVTKSFHNDHHGKRWSYSA